MYYKTKKIVFFFIILPISYILLFELILRVAIFLFTFNSGILIYGINKNISLSLHSISKGEFYIVNSSKLINRQVTKKNDDNDQIWIFGGSTSNRGFCDSKNLSWVDFLNTKLVKKNFSRNGINSNFSLNLIMNEFGRKKIPNTIIWANKINETLHSKRFQSKKNRFLHSVSSFKASLKENVLVFYFFEEILIRIFDKVNINIRNEKLYLNENDYIVSSNNFFSNTKEAIELSKRYGVEHFYIVSIFNRLNLRNKETEFFKYYNSKVNKLIDSYNFVKFINTKKLLTSKDKGLELFCDSMHHNYDGKVITANIISKFMND